ncbi:MAG: hypothetical protein HKO98_01665 [Gemmatimonadetes bacterium]|nr:hypothetical protein [Gemmatimonadota bacterium]
MRTSRAALALLAIGAAVRIWGWASHDALFLDELFLALNLRERSLLEMLTPLAYGQNAPVGWLLLQKVVTSVFGDGAHALHLVSLLASLASLALMWALSRRLLSGAWALVPLAAVVFGPFLIWQGIQLKQYSFDVAVTLVLLLMALRVHESRGEGGLLPLGVAGVVAIWFSMPAIFVLAGVGTALFFRLLPRREAHGPRHLAVLVAIGAVWLATFALNYAVFLSAADEVDWLVDYWASGFLPWPPTGVGDLRWFYDIAVGAMERPLGFWRLGLPALLLVLLGVALPSIRRPSRRAASDAEGTTTSRGYRPPALVWAPVLVTLGAAVAQAYPFRERLILFLVPSLAILLGRGVEGLAGRLPAGRALASAVAAGLLLVPAGIVMLWLPRGGLPVASDTRLLFDTLATVARPGDVVVVDHRTSYAARWYGLPPGVVGIDAPEEWSMAERMAAIRSTLAALDESRAWIVIADVRLAPAPPLGTALASDVASRRFTFDATWDWVDEGLGWWAPLPPLDDAVPTGWVRVSTIEVKGAVAFAVEREGPRSLATEAGGPGLVVALPSFEIGRDLPNRLEVLDGDVARRHIDPELLLDEPDELHDAE